MSVSESRGEGESLASREGLKSVGAVVGVVIVGGEGGTGVREVGVSGGELEVELREEFVQNWLLSIDLSHELLAEANKRKLGGYFKIIENILRGYVLERLCEYVLERVYGYVFERVYM